MTKPITDVARRLAIALGWMVPFFAIPAAKIRFREDLDGSKTNTAGVSADGWVFLHTPFCRALKAAELQWVVAHELMHLLMRHFARRGNRDPKLWNVAGDMAINHVLVKAGLTSYPKGALFPPPEWQTWHAERIYDELAKQQQEGGSSQCVQDALEGEGDPAPGGGCGVQDPVDSVEGDDKNGSQNGSKSEATCDREWTEIAAQASAMERSQGSGAGNALADICQIPAARCNWRAILRRGMSQALAAHGRDAQTWTRRSRRAPKGFVLPGWCTNAARCAVVIDTSGSMSDDDLAQCVTETVEIARESGVRLYLVTHDWGVRWAGWLRPQCRPGAIKGAIKGRGGTCAREAYRKVSQATQRFDVMIHLTDGELSWPEWPTNARKRVVALCGYDVAGSVPKGATVVEVG